MDVLQLKDIKPVPDIIHPYTGKIRNESVPLVIDNGM